MEMLAKKSMCCFPIMDLWHLTSQLGRSHSTAIGMQTTFSVYIPFFLSPPAPTHTHYYCLTSFQFCQHIIPSNQSHTPLSSLVGSPISNPSQKGLQISDSHSLPIHSSHFLLLLFSLPSLPLSSPPSLSFSTFSTFYLGTFYLYPLPPNTVQAHL